MYEPQGFAREIFQSRYAIEPTETWSAACHRVAQHVALAEKDEIRRAQVENDFLDELMTNSFMPGGRIWHSSGRPKGNLLNCYVVPVEDSREGWCKAFSDTMITTGMGGGVGLNFAPIRPRGEMIRGTGGLASGPCGLMHIINSQGDVIRSSGGRRPALMMCLDIDHPDVLEFLDKKLDLSQLNNANVSVVIPPHKEEAFIQAIRADADWPLEWGGRVYKTIKARELWYRLVQNAVKSAEPGILNFDLANRMSNIHYYKPLIATNPCLTGDMRLLTAEGYKTLRELWVAGGYQEYDGKPDIDKHGQLMIVNDRGVVPATNVYRTSESAEVYRVMFDNGSYVDATANHRFIVMEDGIQTKKELSELEVGEAVPIVSGGFGQFNDPTYARLAGWIIGDGSIAELPDGQQRAYVRIWESDLEEVASILKADLQAHYIEHTNSSTQNHNWEDKEARDVAGFDFKRLDLVSNVLGRKLKEDGLVPGHKHHVPKSIWQGNKETVANFLKAFFSADGSVQANEPTSNISIRNCQVNVSILEECQLLLQQFGIYSRVLKRREASQKMMNDGKGGKKLYNKKAEFELIISGWHNFTTFQKEIGFFQSHKNAILDNWTMTHKQPINATVTIQKTIKSIDFIGEQETFCLTEPETKKIVINGALKGNCGEIALEAYGACDLGALVLPRFVQDGVFNELALRSTVSRAVRFLDNVLDVSTYPMSEAEHEMHNVRRLGLGVMGLHHMLLLLNLQYDSDEGLAFVDRLFQIIRDAAYLESICLAREKGAFPKFKAEEFLASGYAKTLPEDIRAQIRQYGIRNCALLTIPPTGTTAIVCDVSSGIEPIYSYCYERKYRSGEDLKSEMVYDSVFKTFVDQDRDMSLLQSTYDLNVRAHLEMQKVCQKYIDNAVSKTINIAQGYNFDEISELMLSYLPNLKGVTVYVDGSRGNAPLSGASSLDVAMATYGGGGCRNGTCEI